ncbi:non-homologous end-joining DNA ligase [Cellulomonas sp. zg-ZUI199]|uniref:Non-homologous end-joining DNA ligase n=1 Tax=Cellulomonas wangleii TaxID=2816956 RepID=A0ABX8D064_9CELL|nr:non-homologous end-joining DNA ligase [Cellulomonas wangleii]MBO0926617.1 non-homologous end-joining DNA ligase [Cellulomonas wangleii]QVI60825.1 non-homologous end-joining DNA ligase [Cellulomonas wangleii]
MSAERRTVDVGGRPVRLTHLDRALYPATGTTKAEVMDYLVRVEAAILRQLRDRPVTRIRWPEGVGGEKFFEKNVPRGAPPWLRHQRLPASPGTDDEGTTLDLPFIDDLAGLMWAANSGALELHTPQWTVGPRGGLRGADRLVVDLDPGPGAGLDECARVAHLVAERLRTQGLSRTVPVTSGSKGLQLYAPLPRPRPATEVRELAHDLAHALAGEHPDLVVAVQRKDLRGGKVLLDWSQNHPAKTTITPWSLRGRDRPTVAAPRDWDEIGPGLRQLTADEAADRLARDGDPFDP